MPDKRKDEDTRAVEFQTTGINLDTRGLYAQVILDKVEIFNADNAHKELKKFLGSFDPRTSGL